MVVLLLVGSIVVGIVVAGFDVDHFFPHELLQLPDLSCWQHLDVEFLAGRGLPLVYDLGDLQQVLARQFLNLEG